MINKKDKCDHRLVYDFNSKESPLAEYNYAFYHCKECGKPLRVRLRKIEEIRR